MDISHNRSPLPTTMQINDNECVSIGPMRPFTKHIAGSTFVDFSEDKTHHDLLAIMSLRLRENNETFSCLSISSDTRSFHSAFPRSDMDGKFMGRAAEESAKEKITKSRGQQRDERCMDVAKGMTRRADASLEQTNVAGQASSRSAEDQRRRPRGNRGGSAISAPLPGLAIPRRFSSATQRRCRSGQDLVSFHRESCRLFQSLEGTLASVPTGHVTTSSRPHSTPVTRSGSFSGPIGQEHSPTGPILPNIAALPSLPSPIEAQEEAPSLKRPPPRQTVMSWTTLESRRREYEEIDKAHSGWRGLLNMLTPKWCHGRNSRRKFFRGKDGSDSVRRYRMHLPDEDGGQRSKRSLRCLSCVGG